MEMSNATIILNIFLAARKRSILNFWIGVHIFIITDEFQYIHFFIFDNTFDKRFRMEMLRQNVPDEDISGNLFQKEIFQQHNFDESM